MQVKERRIAEAEVIIRWRRDQLVAAGFPSLLSETVAADSRFDVHALIELSERGCPAELAVRILAPLEEWEAA
jgi:hypothetical protein